MSYIKDIGWLFLIAITAPLWIAAACIVMAVVVGRQLYMWARGNTTEYSRG